MTRKAWIIAKVASEGYCCMAGYLDLCKARGEAAPAMAKNLAVSKDTIYYHYRRDHKCQNYSDCMQDTIQEIKKGP
jgi:hypothetical protein